MKWTENHMARWLAHSDMFNYRRHHVCIPNLTTFIDWEADFVACTKSGYLTEVEIKVSAIDWMNDKLKKKWGMNPNSLKPWYGWKRIKYFYYAAPLELAKRWEEFSIPDFAGVIGVDESKPFPHILRKAQERKPVEKLTQDEMGDLARLAAMRIWGDAGIRTEEVK